MTDAVTPRPSRITIPPRAHPLARLLFALLREQRITYQELEYRSGILRSTIKSYRNEKTPSLQSIEALLGSVGWGLAPYPKLESLSPHVREMAEELGQNFFTDEITLATAVAAAISKPGARGSAENPAPHLQYRQPYWLPEAA